MTDEQLKRCPCCQRKPQAFTRWRNSDALYSWYKCDGTPPCHTGTNHPPSDELQEQKMIEGWNEAVSDEI